MKIIGNKIYEVCADCGDIVQINKFMVGSLHICLTNEEISRNKDQINSLYKSRKKALEEAE